MKTFKKFIGYFIIVTFFIGLIIFTCIGMGTEKALICWGLALVGTAIITAATFLIIDN